MIRQKNRYKEIKILHYRHYPINLGVIQNFIFCINNISRGIIPIFNTSQKKYESPLFCQLSFLDSNNINFVCLSQKILCITYFQTDLAIHLLTL